MAATLFFLSRIEHPSKWRRNTQMADETHLVGRRCLNLYLSYELFWNTGVSLLIWEVTINHQLLFLHDWTSLQDSQQQQLHRKVTGVSIRWVLDSFGSPSLVPDFIGIQVSLCSLAENNTLSCMRGHYLGKKGFPTLDNKSIRDNGSPPNFGGCLLYIMNSFSCLDTVVSITLERDATTKYHLLVKSPPYPKMLHWLTEYAISISTCYLLCW